MKNLSKFFLIAVSLALVTSCVSKKKYDEALAAAEAEKSALKSEIAGLQEQNSELTEKSNKLQSDLNMSAEEIAQLGATVKENNVKIKGLQDAIVEAFDTYDESQVSVGERNGKLYITLANSILFESGRAKVAKESQDVIAKLAEVINANDGLGILVEGHTDNDPVKIHKAKYKDNWGLSSARSLAIVRALEKAGVDGARLTSSGKGDLDPIASNDTKEGRMQNRRTEFVVTPYTAGLYKIYKEELATSSSGSGVK